MSKSLLEQDTEREIAKHPFRYWMKRKLNQFQSLQISVGAWLRDFWERAGLIDD